MVIFNTSIVCLIVALSLMSCAEEATVDTFQTELEQTVKSAKAHVAVAIDYLPHNSKTTIRYGVNEHDTMATMSAIKFPIALCALHASESGTFHLDVNVFGDTLTLRQALSLSVSNSDNKTTDIVLDSLKGLVHVQQYLHDHGFTCMGVGTFYRDMDSTRWKHNWSTAACMNNVLISFYRDSILNTSNTRWLYDQLLNTPTTAKRIKGNLPPGTPVAHKTGTNQNDAVNGVQYAVNDVGIITMPSGDAIVITVFVNDSHYTYDETEALIAKIARMAYNRFD